MVLNTSGNVGIGTTTPRVALDVNGGVRPGSSTTVTSCGSGQANGEGTTRYNYTSHAMEYCNGENWISMNPQKHMQVFTSSGTFTTPAGTSSSTSYTFTVIGAGGSGSGGSSGLWGTGGNGGATAIYVASGAAAGTGIAITIGTGGNGGSSSGNGTGGGLSSVVFNGVTVTANGGAGGSFGVQAAAASTATNGTINIPGGRGSFTYTMGGGSTMGQGGNAYQGTSEAGTAYGAGGGGGSTTNPRTGGAGANGVVIVEWNQ
jgi:hypothetical protein